MTKMKVPKGGYTYQSTQNYFAQVGEGLETLAEEELLSLGAKHVKLAYRGMYFKAEPQALYKITYMSRFIQKIIATLEKAKEDGAVDHSKQATIFDAAAAAGQEKSPA